MWEPLLVFAKNSLMDSAVVKKIQILGIVNESKKLRISSIRTMVDLRKSATRAMADLKKTAILRNTQLIEFIVFFYIFRLTLRYNFVYSNSTLQLDLHHLLQRYQHGAI